jgi:RNA polymerase sigma-70 factor (sigma-E family)
VEKMTAKGLAELYARHATSATRFAYVLTGDEEAAKDIVQEAFIRIYARFKDRKPPEALETYLRRTILNLSNDYFRRLGRARALSARSLRPPGGSGESQAVDDRLSFRDALSTLSARQRAAVVLRYLDDLSEQQVSEVLHCSIPAVRSLVARGIRSLRKNMELGNQ